MKIRFSIFVLLACIVATQTLAAAAMHRRQAWRTAGGGGGGCSYLECEGFNVTGFDNPSTWTKSSGTGTINEDYTSNVFEGAETMRLAFSAQNMRVTNFLSSAYSSLDYFFVIYVTTGAAANYRLWTAIDSAHGETCCNIRMTASGSPNLTLIGGSNGSTTDAWPTATYIYCWVTYTPGTGANASASLAWSTDGTRPTSGTKFKSFSNGTGTVNPQGHFWGAGANVTYEVNVDKVRSNNSTIGDNPS